MVQAVSFAQNNVDVDVNIIPASFFFALIIQANLNVMFFTSACYLKTQAQSVLFTGSLKNSSQDDQLSRSSKHMLKAVDFFKVSHRGCVLNLCF